MRTQLKLLLFVGPIIWSYMIKIAHSFPSTSKQLISSRNPQTTLKANIFAVREERLVSDIPLEERGIGVGIDLGTTNSAVSILEPSSTQAGERYTATPILLRMPNSTDRTLPSVVCLLGGPSLNHQNVFGKEAAKLEQLYPQCTYRHVKRILGTGGKQAAQNAALVPNLVWGSPPAKEGTSKRQKIDTQSSIPLTQQLSEAEKYPAKLTWTDPNHQAPSVEFDPEIVSACILRYLFDLAEKHYDEQDQTKQTIARVTRAVVGVPAYFNDAQREATVRACQIAGVPKVRLLKEPEAAALAYGLGKDQANSDSDFDDELILVFDLGGGTFDVSVLAVGGGIMEVVATSGNAMLGGSDFDKRIANWIMEKVSMGKNEAVMDPILRSAEAIRIYLSNAKRVTLALPTKASTWLELNTSVIVPAGEEPPVPDNDVVVVELSRREMEALCEQEFQELLKPVREVAILAGALLPGDSSPQVVEAALQLEEQQRAALEFKDFYDSDTEDEDDASLLPGQIDLKTLRKQQQSSRRKARDLAKSDKKFRSETLKAKNRAKKSLFREPNGGGNVKVQDSIGGRPLSQVVLVGGATRMPAIGRMLAIITGVTPKRTVNPDEAVALGAAIQVGILDGDERLGDLQVLSPMKAAMMRAIATQQQKQQQQK